MEKVFEDILDNEEKRFYDDLLFHLGFDFSEDACKRASKKARQLLIASSGPNRFFRCEEKYGVINLKKDLKRIRFLNREKVLLLAIKGEEIVAKKTFRGKKNRVDVTDYTLRRAFAFIEKYTKQGAKILNYHNHPDGIAARPSNKDINGLSIYTDLEQKLDYSKYPAREVVIKRLKRRGLEGFTYADWGVVTKFDFFSSSQKKDDLFKLYEEENKNDKIMEEFLEEIRNGNSK